MTLVLFILPRKPEGGKRRSLMTRMSKTRAMGEREEQGGRERVRGRRNMRRRWLQKPQKMWEKSDSLYVPYVHNI